MSYLLSVIAFIFVYFLVVCTLVFVRPVMSVFYLFVCLSFCLSACLLHSSPLRCLRRLRLFSFVVWQILWMILAMMTMAMNAAMPADVNDVSSVMSISVMIASFMSVKSSCGFSTQSDSVMPVALGLSLIQHSLPSLWKKYVLAVSVCCQSVGRSV